MSGINMRRVVLGGLAAGLIANAFDFAITTYFLADEFALMLGRLNVDEVSMQSWLPAFAAADFVWGFLLVFTYAAIRPRFGAGPTAALIAGIIVWTAMAVFSIALLAMGLHTLASYSKSALLYLASALGSSLAGAALYKE